MPALLILIERHAHAQLVQILDDLEQAHLPMRRVKDNQLVERRRNGKPDQSPMTVLKQLPALVVLERIPVPVLAVAKDGAVVFANTAFSEMVGRAPGHFTVHRLFLNRRVQGMGQQSVTVRPGDLRIYVAISISCVNKAPKLASFILIIEAGEELDRAFHP